MPSPRLPADETGHDPMRREEASLFCRPVSSRYGRGAMIITTNKSIRDRTEPLAGDGVPATAILDRLLRRRPRPRHQGPQLPPPRPRGRSQGPTRSAGSARRPAPPGRARALTHGGQPAPRGRSVARHRANPDVA